MYFIYLIYFIIYKPTIASVFNEHEIYSMLLLRNIRLRQLRHILLCQMNFFRSIEKRVTLDHQMKVFSKSENVDPKDSIQNYISHMYLYRSYILKD